MKNELSKARKDSMKIISFNEQLTLMHEEFSSLGIFAIRKKKELQAQINSVENQLKELKSSSEIHKEYKKRLSKLNSEETFAITSAEQKTREKYPLPRK